MKTKHTPGPWITLTDVLSDERILILSQGKSHGGDEVTICETLNDLFDDQREHQANAQLISAAPEMLEALEQAAVTLSKLKEFVPISSQHKLLRETFDLMLTIKAALAKATGGAK